jgi:CubicO group peptidase (beta-lactamase class C family)
MAQDSAIDELITAYAKLNVFNGSALVAAHGKIILEKGYGPRDVAKGTPNDSNTIFQIASVTKTFTSAVILHLVETQKLKLSDKLSRFYPDFPKGDSITVENLLTHTSGIFDYTHRDTASDVHTEQKMMAFLRSQPLDFSPGTDWSYSNSGYSILGFIIQKVTGMTYEQAVRQYIFQPLHMSHSGFDFEHLSGKDKATGYDDSVHETTSYSDSSIVFAAGAIYSTVGDLYRWHEGLQRYQIVGKILMDRAYVPFMKNYGYGWIIDSVDGNRMVYHSGNIAGFSSLFARVTDGDVCIILLNNKQGTELETMARKIMDILYHRPYEIPAKKHAITLPESTLSRYVGTYTLQTHPIVFDVVLDQGKLLARLVNGPTFPLTAEKENLFFIQDGVAKLEFVMDASGHVDHVVFTQNDQSDIGKKTK